MFVPKIASPSDFAFGLLGAATTTVFVKFISENPYFDGFMTALGIFSVIAVIESVAWTPTQASLYVADEKHEALIDRLDEENERLSAENDRLIEEVEALAQKNELLMDDLDSLIAAEQVAR